MGGAGSCPGAHLDRLLRQEQRLLPLCQLQADGSGVPPSSGGAVPAALVAPGQETKRQAGEQPLCSTVTAHRATPRAVQLLCTLSSSAPPCRGASPCGDPQEHHQQHSPHCRGGLLRAAPSCAPHLRAACQAQRLQQNGVFGRELPTPQSPPALRGRPKVMEDVVQMLRVHSDGPGAPTTSLGSPLHPWTTLTIRTFPNAQSEPPGCGFMPPPHALSSAPTHQRLPPLAQFTSPSISTRPTPAALPHGSPRL